MNVSRATAPCMQLSKSLVAPSTTGLVSRRWYALPPHQQANVHPGYIKIKEQYKKFQIDDGTPIHLKGGPVDKVLYYTTLVGCGVGLAMTFEYYYSAAFPKKG